MEVGVSWMRAFGGDDGAERREAVREHREEVVRAYGPSGGLPEPFAGERFVVTSGDDASTGARRRAGGRSAGRWRHSAR